MHIPFSPVDFTKVIAGEQMDIESSLSKARKESSSAIGYITSMASFLVSESAQEYKKNILFPFVAKHLPNVHMRTQKCYTLILLSARLVSI